VSYWRSPEEQVCVPHLAYLLEALEGEGVLEDREIFVLRCRFGIDCEKSTLQEIAAHLPNPRAGQPQRRGSKRVKAHLSREQTRSIVKGALFKIDGALVSRHDWLGTAKPLVPECRIAGTGLVGKVRDEDR